MVQQPARCGILRRVAEDLASERVGTLDQALALIRQNVATLVPASA
ncbi:MAG TPA: hypothetical protein VNZ53_40940 [Steroidobacteraceae bacterium]|nr:hypothetical protein [Steroidobacteraceae bacterium]